MGASRAGSAAERAADLTASASLPASSPAAVLEFAVERLLHGPEPDALAAVLQRLAGAFGGRTALAVQHQADRPMVVLAAYPERAARDPALLAMIQADDPPPGLLLASPPDGDRSLCTLVLAGDSAAWAPEARSTLRTIAAIVAAQIRQASTAAGLAERRAVNVALIRETPNAVVTANSSWRIVEFNRSAEKLFGHRREDVLGQPLADLLPAGDRDRFLRDIQSYRQPDDLNDSAHRIRVPVLLADGTDRQVEMTRVPLTVEGETYFCGIVRDLTELERAQAAVAASEQRFRMLAQLAPVGIVQTDASGECVFVNERWCALTGITEQDAAATNWARFLHPDDVPRLEREWARAAEHGAELRIDCRLLPVGGGEVWVHAAAMPMPGPDGQPAGYLAALTNISDRKRAEAERERLLAAEQEARRSFADQTERLNSVLAAAIRGIFISDERGLITNLNQAFCDLFGLPEPPAELIGTPATQVVRRVMAVLADPSRFARRTKEALAERKPVSGEQVLCADGRTLELDYWPVSVDGEHRGDLLLLWDVSERKALEEQRERLLAAEFAARELAELAQGRLEEQNAALREFDEAKTHFLATMSHELRTPLSSIVSFVELIKDSGEQLTEDTVSSLDVIQRNANRLLRLVGDLLLLSRIEAGSMPLELEPVSIPGLVEQVGRSAAPGAARQGVQIEVSSQDGPPVQADETRLQQVFDNLVSNAVKFTGAGGAVHIAARHDDSTWQIAVEDSGIGIPAAELDHIFDRFVRASNARIGGLPGTGLGLSVVKATTELHGGRVEAESTVGSGTTFRVYLPMSTS
jgi:PAS domain S-box-containing protein